MAIVAALLILLMASLSGCSPQSRPATAPAYQPEQRPFDVAPHIRFILDSQRDTGAIALTPAREKINPYFANLAAQALLLHPGHLDPVERYMDWYMAHLNDDGTIDDYVVINGQEISTGSADSTDSYAATFLSLVTAWVEAGGSPDWLDWNRSGLEKVEGALLSVTDTDGLTWAKPRYPHKFLMDNAEVYRGWRDWSRLMQARDEHEPAMAAAARADAIGASLPRFRRSDGTLSWAITLLGIRHWSRPGRFYPEGVAQLFPLAFGLTDDPSGYHAFDAMHPRWRYLQVGDFPWLLPAYAAALAGDGAAARQALAQVELQYPALGWPWFIAESAWAIRTAALLE